MPLNNNIHIYKNNFAKIDLNIKLDFGPRVLEFLHTALVVRGCKRVGGMWIAPPVRDDSVLCWGYVKKSLLSMADSVFYWKFLIFNYSDI